MTELLCKLFIKDRGNVRTAERRRAYGVLGSVVGIILNILLAVGKYTIGYVFGAISLMADGINNLSDAGSQIISLISFKIAAKPADREHPFGHARIEYVASMIVSFLILHISIDLVTESFGKITGGTSKTEFSWIMIAVLFVSVLVKVWLFFFNRKLADKIGSAVMRATAADSLSDAGATLAVAVAMLIYKFTGFDADGYMGIVVAVIIFIAGIKILNETKNSILGEKPDEETVENIKRVVGEFPDALGIHDMIVHNYGPGRVIATMHVEVDGAKSVFDSHDMIDLIERRLSSELGIQSNIHMDPIVTDDAEVLERKEAVADIVHKVDGRIDIHDFRLVRGKTHSNLIFDVNVPFEIKMSDSEIKSAISKMISEYDNSCFAVMNIDRS